MAVDLPADVRGRLRGLRLWAQRAGAVSGIGSHASRSRGAGLEFAQYRAYEPGDEVRQVDWKLYARSERLFVREAERENPLTLWIVIDASASMGQGDAARAGWSRLDAAKLLAVCLAELALAGGDRFGWIVPGVRGVVAAPADGRRQRDRLRLDLAFDAAAAPFAAADLAPLYERIGAHDLVLVLSDLFDDAVVEMILRLAAARRDVAVIQILTAEERDFPFADGRRFVDPESGNEVIGDGPAMRANFIRDFAAARATLAARLGASGVRLATHFLDEAADVPLRALFGAPTR